VVAGNVVVVVNDRGQIHAFRVTPLAAPPPAKKSARKDAHVSAPGK
jgi:hypothetical protein